MAFIKIVSKHYDTPYDVSNLIYYVLNPAKFENNIWGSRYLYLYNDPLYTATEITSINSYYGKTQGSIVKHLIVSYPYLSEQCPPQKVEYALKQMLDINLAGFPYIYALHENTSHPHFHVILGSVNLYYGMKYPDKNESLFSMAETMSHYTIYKGTNNIEKHMIYDVFYDTVKNNLTESTARLSI